MPTRCLRRFVDSAHTQVVSPHTRRFFELHLSTSLLQFASPDIRAAAADESVDSHPWLQIASSTVITGAGRELIVLIDPNQLVTSNTTGSTEPDREPASACAPFVSLLRFTESEVLAEVPIVIHFPLE